MFVDVEKLGHDGRRLQPFADDEEKRHHAPNLMPKETRPDDAKLTQLRKRKDDGMRTLQKQDASW